MRDPMDELENFTSPGLTMDPLPAAEVRRRGTRLRRRNTALAAAGGVLAVAVIAAPFALMNGHQGSSEPHPSKPTPSVSWQQTIPADFPLAEGLPTPTDTRSTYESPVTDVCKGSGWGPADAVDVRQATYTADERASTHTLALYPTEREAELTLLSLQAATQACVLQTDGQDRTVEVLPSEDDQSVVYANHYSDAGDLDVVQLVRVGNAILQATTYSNGVPAHDTADQVVQGSAAVVDAMCVFSAEGCGSTSTAVDPTPDGSVTGPTTVPADFPLLDGLPTRAATKDFGRYGPGQDEALLEIPGCGQDVLKAQSPTDWIRGGWHDPAEARNRQLVVFPSDLEATKYVESFARQTTCDTEDLGGGLTRIHSGAGSDLNLGNQAMIAITWYRQDGKPAPGFRATEMVRVGNAVVVQDRIADGLNDLVTSAYLEQIIGESDQSLPGVVDAMCVFAASGC